MVAIQIRDVPEDVHAELVRQAEEAEQSLNKYLLGVLRESIRGGGNAEVFARAAARKGNPPPGHGARLIREMRDAASGDR